MLPQKRFIKRTLKCPYTGCEKLVVNSGGLTQHIQASHAAAERHPVQLPAPRLVDREEAPFNDDAGGPGDDERIGQQHGPFTVFHPLIDG